MNIEEIYQRNPKGLREILRTKTVGITGCGGLGSNVAVALTRAGIGKLIIADYDTVEPANLNRQFFFLDDIGSYKVDAIKKYLLKINPEIQLFLLKEELTPTKLKEHFSNVDILIEAFDAAEKKKWLIDTWCKCFSQLPLVSASGLGGYGNSANLQVVRAGNLYICGDQTSNIHLDGLCSTRIGIVAHMQANTAVEILMQEKVSDNS